MICLCSTSTSRALILNNFGIEFVQKSTNYDEEQITTPVAREFVYIASRGKLESAIKEFGLDIPLLCADTVIATKDGQILRKPKSIEDARAILNIQSGSQISIITSVHLKTKIMEFSNISTTDYHFNTFNQEDLENYLSGGEWEGKAGGCMVEGFCQKYIKSVDGLESNAMGLQIEKILGWLE
ncbi:MAG: septum formation inhibitor Maf [Sulfurovum sp.]